MSFKDREKFNLVQFIVEGIGNTIVGFLNLFAKVYYFFRPLFRTIYFKTAASILVAVLIAWLTSVVVQDNKKVVVLFRSLAINELVMTDDLNSASKFEASTSSDSLPTSFIDIDLDSDLIYALESKLGSAQFYFLKANIDEVDYLNQIVRSLRDSVINGQLDSPEFQRKKKEYLKELKRLDGNDVNARVSPFKDTGCLLFMLNKIYLFSLFTGYFQFFQSFKIFSSIVVKP